MGRPERAIELFSGGYACSQAVLLPWSERLGLDEAIATRISAPFAAGMQLGSLCGAFTGALMVIGLATCTDLCTTREGRTVTVDPTLELATRFREHFGSLDCPDVIGCDIRDPQTRQRASDEGLFTTRCAPAVRAASEILEDLLGPS